MAGAAVAAVLALAPATATSRPGHYQRTCDTHAEGPLTTAEPPVRAQDVRLHRLVFIGLDRRHRWQPPHPGSSGTLKIPVRIREGSPVTVRITPLGRTRARLDFNPERWSRRDRRVAAGDGQRVVRFHACPADTRRFTDGRPLGPWTGYPGGFLVDRPGCATLTVSARGTPTVRRRVALGVAVARCRPTPTAPAAA